MKLYISHLCPDCPPAMEYLDSKGIEYEVYDIQADILILKEFLGLRDKLEVFDEIKKEGYIGVPCLINNSGEYLFYEEIMSL